MCGISGYIGESKKPILTYQIITKLFEKSESRGSDAAGFWGTKSGSNGNVLYHKEPLRASSFTKKEVWNAVLQHNPNLLLVHARGASKGVGEPANNQNNHPFTNRNKSIGLIHNGRVDDSEYYPLKQKYETSSQCDSEILLRIFEAGELYSKDHLFETFGEVELPERLAGIRDIFSLVNEGHMAVAVGERAVNGDRFLWLFRNDYRPIWVVDMRDQLGQVFFVSEPQIWDEAMRECSGAKGIALSQKLIELPTDEVWFLKISENKPIPDGVQRFEVVKGESHPWKFDGIKCPQPERDSTFEVITKLDEKDKVKTKEVKPDTKPVAQGPNPNVCRTVCNDDVDDGQIKQFNSLCEEIDVIIQDIRAEVGWQYDNNSLSLHQLSNLLLDLEQEKQALEEFKSRILC